MIAKQCWAFRQNFNFPLIFTHKPFANSRSFAFSASQKPVSIKVLESVVDMSNVGSGEWLVGSREIACHVHRNVIRTVVRTLEISFRK